MKETATVFINLTVSMWDFYATSLKDQNNRSITSNHRISEIKRTFNMTKCHKKNGRKSWISSKMQSNKICKKQVETDKSGLLWMEGEGSRAALFIFHSWQKSAEALPCDTGTYPSSETSGLVQLLISYR